MDVIKRIFENNRAWVRETTEQDPQFFERMLGGQSRVALIELGDSRGRPQERFQERRLLVLI